MPEVLNGRPQELFGGADDYEHGTRITCPICGYIGARLRITDVFTRIPLDVSADLDSAPIHGTEIGGTIPGESALAIVVRCAGGHEFELLLAHDTGRIRVAMVVD